MATSKYVPRLLDGLLQDLLQELPALMLVGPRASGKTTTARQLALDVIQLDRPAEAAAARSDPDALLNGRARPLLIDEWQEVPEILGAVKRLVDADPRPGQFLLTGSVRADMETQTWPGTGRVVRLSMFGLTARESEGLTAGAPLLDRIADGEPLTLPPDPPDVRGYVRLALGSAFPEPALHLGERAQQRWMDGYIDQILTRDAVGIEPGRDPQRMGRFLEAYAFNTAGIVDDAKLFAAAGINRKTAVAYERLLANLFVVEPLPAWTSNRLKGLGLRPKRHVVDTGLAAAVLRIDEADVFRDGALLGRLLDSFVTAQLRAEVPLCASRPRLFHAREEHGRHEVDLLAEVARGRVIAFEIKADAAPGPVDARHLVWLKERLGSRFLRGIVFHTGRNLYPLGEDIVAAPICAIWGGRAQD